MRTILPSSAFSRSMVRTFPDFLSRIRMTPRSSSTDITSISALLRDSSLAIASPGGPEPIPALYAMKSPIIPARIMSSRPPPRAHKTRCFFSGVCAGSGGITTEESLGTTGGRRGPEGFAAAPHFGQRAPSRGDPHCAHTAIATSFVAGAPDNVQLNSRTRRREAPELLVLTVFAGKVHHGFQVFRLHFIHYRARPQDESAVLADHVDEPFAVLLNSIRIAGLQQRCGHVSGNADVAAQDLLGPGHVGSVEARDHLPSRQFAQVFETLRVVAFEEDFGSVSRVDEGMHQL